MSTPRWERIKEIVEGALDRDPSEREKFLDKACPDSKMRKEVESLLAHEAEGFLEEPASADFDGPKGAPASDLTGKTLSHYKIQEKLGRGGMGEVFLAQDQSLDRRVALKLLATELEHDETAKKRFLREAKSAAALDHPYICKIYEIGEAEVSLQPERSASGARAVGVGPRGTRKCSFIAMEYIGGETLGDRVKRNALTLLEAQRIASEILEALETAHRENIVHRDLKPSNIMLTVGGHVKVLDFGLAKRMTGPEAADSQFETASQLTGKGMTLGTLAYMSPEQLRGQPVDARSDIFSFGIVLYEMLAGEHPFSKATSMDTAASILNLPQPPLTRYRPEAPELLDHIVSKMLAKEPGERYQLVHEVRTDLERVASGATVPETRLPTIKIPKLEKKQIRIIGAAAFAALVLVAALVFLPDAFGPSTTRAGPPSVAVLPLTNISDDPLESDYLADGISQAVTSKLTQVGLRVTPWETAQRFRDSNRSAEAVARELNVEAVLVGTFQVAGDQILTNVSLIEAENGFQSWADIIVEPYEDIFRMQLRIATGVAESLKKELTGEEVETLAKPAAQSVEAYDFYLQGAHFALEGSQESTNVAFQFFSRAVELDPNLVEAHVGLGSVYSARYNYGWEGGLENLESAEASFEKALRLNPADMRARRGLIFVYFFRGRSEACLIHGKEAARAGEPHDVETLMTQAQAYLMGGIPDRGAPLFRRITEMDPANDGAHWNLTWAHAWAGNYAEAIEAGDTYLRRFGDDFQVHTAVGLAHHASGSKGRAREHYDKATSLGSQTASISVEIPLLYSGILFEQRGDRARAESEWRRGLEMAQRSLEGYPDNTGRRVYVAAFQLLLGDQTASSRERARALEDDFAPYELYSLAAAHGAVGETKLAAEVLDRTLQLGRVLPLWRLYLTIASPSSLESDPLQSFIEEYEAEVRRLGELY